MDHKINCEHCNTTFKTKSALNSHINKAKYCLLIRKKNEQSETVSEKEKVFKCKHCKKILSSKQSLKNHMNCCYEKKDGEFKELRERTDREFKELKERTDREFKELKEQTEKKLFEKDKVLIKVNTQLESLKEQLEKQEENYREQIKDLQDKLDRIANKAIDRPTTTVTNTNTTNNNNLNIMTPIDFDNYEILKDAIDTKLNANHIVDGQRGLAQFLVDAILKDSEGNLKYKCTDSSRGIFKFLNSEGEIHKDVDAKKLISYVVNGGIKGKSVEIANRWYRDEDGVIDMMKYEIMNEPQQHILKIQDDSSCFRRELASMTIAN
jgi:cell division protein ZapA (FtsZ GTPase activity inhibitor)